MIRLQRDGRGRLMLLPEHEGAAADAVGEPVVPVRAFPLSAPDEGIALVGSDGRERAWIPRLDALPDGPRALIVEGLASREFAPVIRRITAISAETTPCTWTVETDRGDARLMLKSEESIRRLPGGALLIGDSRGFAFRIPDVAALDPQSRRWLDRFL